jgi:hypothetical protein
MTDSLHNNNNTRDFELDIKNFSYDREFIKRQKFIMANSCYLPISLIKFAETQIDRKKIVNNIDKLINCFPISIQIEKGLFEFTLNYIKTSLLEPFEFSSVYIDKLNEICDNLDMKNNKINNKTLLPALLDGSISAQTLPLTVSWRSSMAMVQHHLQCLKQTQTCLLNQQKCCVRHGWTRSTRIASQQC